MEKISFISTIVLIAAYEVLVWTRFYRGTIWQEKQGGIIFIG